MLARARALCARPSRKSLAAPGWRANNVRPYILYITKQVFFLTFSHFFKKFSRNTSFSPLPCHKLSIKKDPQIHCDSVSKNLPLRGRCPEGAEGENLAIARNISDSRTVLSPPPPAGGAPSQRGPRGEHTFFDRLPQIHCESFSVTIIASVIPAARDCAAAAPRFDSGSF